MKFEIGDRVKLKKNVKGHFDEDEGVKRTGYIMDVEDRENIEVQHEAPKDYIQQSGYPMGIYKESELKKIARPKGYQYSKR